jgi:hypothetical protein
MRRSMIVLMAAAGLTLASPVFALMVEVSMPEMVATSTDIVRTRVVDLNSYWVDSPHVIRTDVRVQVTETWKGALAPASTITVTMQGGTVGDVSMQQEDQPDLRPGDDVVLFLQGLTGANTHYQITNDFQGHYVVQGNQVLSPRLETLKLSELHARVQRLAAPSRH